MTDDAPEHRLTVAEAVETLDRATAFAEPLRRRSEGVTIALWGFVSACIVLSNGVLDDAYGFYDAGGWRRAVSSLLWVPWAAIGVLGTVAVWRIAEVSARRREPGRRRSPAVLLAWFAVLVALVFLIAVVPHGAAGFAIAVVGVIWIAVGTLDVYKATPTGRRTLVAVGTGIVAAGVAFGWLTRATPHAGWDHLEAVGTLTIGLLPIAGGLWQALRG